MNDDGDELDAQDHASSCQGQAVYIDDYDGEAIPVCIHPGGISRAPAPAVGIARLPAGDQKSQANTALVQELAQGQSHSH
jgi:hypothetical protein